MILIPLSADYGSVSDVQLLCPSYETSSLNPQTNQSDYVICGVKLPNSEDFQGN